MIKTKNELKLITIIGLLSSAVSYAFTILMLMSFAETSTEKALYFLCGIIIDGTKWFSLVTMIKYYKAQLYKNFFAYGFLFLCFFTMSVVASVSFSVYTVRKQMYTTTTVENATYKNTLDQISKLKDNITTLESDKINEINRLNTELDGLPLDYITRRKELSDKKIELTNFYDNKIAPIKAELDLKTIELNSLDNKPTEIKKLNASAIAGFFETIANVTKVNIDNIIIVFAVALGVILDLASIALTFDKAFSFQNKRSFNKQLTELKNMREVTRSLKDKLNDDDTDSDIDNKPNAQIINFQDFIKFINDNDLDINNLKYSDISNYIKQPTFYKYMNKIKEEYQESNNSLELA